MTTIVALVALVIWLGVAAMQLYGARFVVRERDTFPAYKWLKNALGAIGVLAVLARLTGITGTLPYTLGLLGFLFLASLVELRHILRRYRDDDYLTIKTRRGKVAIKSKDEAQLIVSEASGIIRHHRLGTKETLDEAALIEMREALGLPTASEWESEQRAKLQRRREGLARDGIFAAEVDLWRRELRGGNDGG
jgi:hypothetical protein